MGLCTGAGYVKPKIKKKKGRTKFGKFYQWFWLELPVTNSKFSVPVEKVFCSKCKYYLFDNSKLSSFRCEQPCVTEYKKKTKDTPIDPGVVELTIHPTENAWKRNKNNKCKYYKEK